VKRSGDAAGARGLWTALAVAATVAVQLVSAIPEPSYFVDGQGSAEIEASLSRVLFAPGETMLNLLHFPAFALLGWLWCRAAAAWIGPRPRALAAGVAAATLFALGNELSQALVPTRHASGVDALVDLAGVAVGAWIFHRGARATAPAAAPESAE